MRRRALPSAVARSIRLTLLICTAEPEQYAAISRATDFTDPAVPMAEANRESETLRLIPDSAADVAAKVTRTAVTTAWPRLATPELTAAIDRGIVRNTCAIAVEAATENLETILRRNAAP